MLKASLLSTLVALSALSLAASARAQEGPPQNGSPDRAGASAEEKEPEGEKKKAKERREDGDRRDSGDQRERNGGEQRDRGARDTGDARPQRREKEGRETEDRAGGEQRDQAPEPRSKREPRPEFDRGQAESQQDELNEKAATRARAEAEREARERARAKAEAEKQEQAERGEAEKAAREEKAQRKREAERAKQDAEEKEAARAKAEAEREAAAAARPKEEAKKQEQADRAKQDAEAKEKEAARAKADAEREADEAARAKAEAEKQEQADRARAEAERRQNEKSDRTKTEADTKPETEQSKQAPTREAAEDAPPPGASDTKAAEQQPRGAERRERRSDRATMPTDETKAKETIKEERAKADVEFEQAREKLKSGTEAEKAEAPRVDARTAAPFEEVRKKRRERIDEGGMALIEEPDQRVIVREGNRAHVRHDESKRINRVSRELRRERRDNGITVSVFLGFGGVEIISEEDEYGRLLRRMRRDREGRELVLIDNRDFYRRHARDRGRFVEAYIDLPPPEIRIPRAKYVVDYEAASYDDIYEALIAPPIERLERGYSLEEVRQSYPLRQRMRRVDLDAINFDFASWEVAPDQYPKLERIAEAMKRIIDRNPDEIFMIEGHTDAVGSDIDNLSLSDRRAESVAIILSDTFRVPPENLTTQGYGEQFLKVETLGPSRANRRVAVRRITPLLSRTERQSRE